ncbi:hypothetical protein CNQ49_24530 (plasmid) [Escherichia coli]|nr:hypothetical protein CNQ49_24530 [Escherichia coli]TEZ78296.1 hypothetical protein BON79_19255 [Escherichia coli]TEZ84051.1 hypothetical protein BON78_06310 [Escherichia coli]
MCCIVAIFPALTMTVARRRTPSERVYGNNQKRCTSSGSGCCFTSFRHKSHYFPRQYISVWVT